MKSAEYRVQSAECGVRSVECRVNKQLSIISVVGAGFQGKGKYYVLGSKPALIINHPLSINNSRKVRSQNKNTEYRMQDTELDKEAKSTEWGVWS